MGLNVAPQNDVLELTPLYLSTTSKELLLSITEKLNKAADENSIIKDSNDTFAISEMKSTPDEMLTDHIKNLSIEKEMLQVVYPPKSITKDLQIPYTTPNFNLNSFFESLLSRRKQEWGGGSWYQFGNAVIYSEVTTSTQTVLDKNYSFSQCLPNGLVCLATNQIAGRGRGRNSWVSQAGGLQFSFIVRHSIEYKNAPVVFIQYLIALSIVESIRSRPGYEDVPLRLKWPNDIYADLPNNQGLKKVGGLLVNSSFIRDEFLLVVGCGVNLNNSHPTVSINDVIAQHNPQLEKLEKEDLLAHALVTFEKYYMEFCEKGMGSWFLDKYYKRWLHR
jgi:biotin--protein ligase